MFAQHVQCSEYTVGVITERSRWTGEIFIEQDSHNMRKKLIIRPSVTLYISDNNWGVTIAS
jgi:hypothetical protein